MISAKNCVKVLSGAVIAVLLAGTCAVVCAGDVKASDYFSKAQVERAARFNRYLYVIFCCRELGLLSFLAVAAFTRLAFSYERDVERMCFRKKRLVLPVYIFFVLVMIRLVVLPFDAVRDLLVRRSFGLTTQGAGGWLADRAKGFIVGDIWFIPLLVLIYAAMRRLRRTWWLVSAGAMGLALIAWYSLAPHLVEPLFYRFSHVRSEKLRGRLQPLLEKSGLDKDSVCEADSGKRTREVNAYASGLFLGRRIVLYDVLAEEADPSEIEFVAAHEIAHWKKNHVLKGVALGTVGAAVVLYLVGRLLRLTARTTMRGGAGHCGAASVPVFFFWLEAILFLAMPVECTISRRFEARADQYAIELTGNPEGAIRLFRKVARKNLSDLDPPPPAKLWLHSHPTVAERIRDAARGATTRAKDRRGSWSRPSESDERSGS